MGHRPGFGKVLWAIGQDLVRRYGGVCSIFLRVDISINKIFKPKVLFLNKVFYKKYVFIYY
jgi:hypothetical protein